MKVVNPDVVFYLSSEGIVAHNSLSQRSFELDAEHFGRLLEINSAGNSQNDSVDKNLFSGGLIVESPTLNEWGGDYLSRLAYNFLKVRNQHTPKKDKQQVFDDMLSLSKSVDNIPPSVFCSFSFKKKICLPQPNPESLNGAGLFDLLKSRMTCRQFTHEPITQEALSTILYVNLGYIHGKSWDDLENNGFRPNGFRKANPSASGTQTFEACVIVLNVEGLEDGIYWYDPDHHSLSLLMPGFSQDDLSHLVCDQYWTNGISCGILLIADLRRLWIKNTKTRGIAIAYTEAGHISENLLLSCSALGLQTWITGTFRDDDIHQSILKNIPYLSPCFFIGFGHGKKTGVPKELELSV